MSLDLALVAAIETVTPNVWPAPAPPSKPTPRVTYQRVTGMRHATLNSGMGAPKATFQIDVWGPVKGPVAMLAEQLKESLPGALKVGELTDNDDDYEDDTKLYRSSFDVTIWK